MYARRRGFRAKQVPGADLNGGRTEREGSDHAAGVCNAAGRDDRDAHRPNDLWHERERAGLCCQIIR